MVYPLITYCGPAYSDDLDADDSEGVRELDSRCSDGIHVRLLWNPADGHVSVAVHDTKTGDAFEVRVGANARARDVYHHPYAYAVAA